MNATEVLWPRASKSNESEGLTPSEIIKHAEEHWNVSGTSVLLAWGLTAVGSVSTFCSLY